MKTALKTPSTGTLTVLPPDAPAVPAAVSADFEQVRFFCNAAKEAGTVMTYAMVLVGVELCRLHKAYGVRAGRPSKGKLPTDSGISWPELVKREAGISDDWARTLMALGIGARKRIAELNSKQVLGTPFPQLPETVRERVVTAMRDLVEGETLKGLAQQWGVVKPKAKLTGGGSGRTPGSTKKTTPSEDAQEQCWPIENALGTVGLASNFEAMILLLPEHRADGNPSQASLTGLHEQLTHWLSTVEGALKHRKHERRASRA